MTGRNPRYRDKHPNPPPNPQPPVPPQARSRKPGVQAVPMPPERRVMHYQIGRLGYNPGVLDGLTGPQLRREASKRHAAGRLPARRIERAAAAQARADRREANWMAELLGRRR